MSTSIIINTDLSRGRNQNQAVVLCLQRYGTNGNIIIVLQLCPVTFSTISVSWSVVLVFMFVYVLYERHWSTLSTRKVVPTCPSQIVQHLFRCTVKSISNVAGKKRCHRGARRGRNSAGTLVCKEGANMNMHVFFVTANCFELCVQLTWRLLQVTQFNLRDR